MSPDSELPTPAQSGITTASTATDGQASLYSTSSPPETSAQIAGHLLQQCRNLLAEVDALQGLLAQRLRNPQLVEVRQFRSNVTAELRMLEKLEQQVRDASGDNGSRDSDGGGGGGDDASEQAQQTPEVEMRLLHALRSSNLPFYQAVWKIARGSCTGLIALGKRFYWDGETKRSERAAVEGRGKKQPNKDKRKSVFVDIIADDGEEWVKVSTISESRLLFEMAKKGWERESDEDEGTGSEGEGGRTILQNFDGDGEDSDEDDELELIKLARDLKRAADATRVRYRHPRLRVVIPKIEEGNVPEIDDILREMRSYGIKIECQESLSGDPTTANLARLLPQPFKRFTPTLNVDCTLLLAIVSDLSHVKDMPPLPNFHKAILRQIEVEKQQPLLSTELWPAMGEHNLICTKEAATRMCDIVETIGTATEKTRTQIMMGDAPYDHCDHNTLIQKFQELSEHPVPTGWKIPIRVVEAQSVIDAAKAQDKLPSVADEIAKGLSDINHSVFMYGWVTGLMTVSSNRTIDRQIEATIEKNRQGNNDLEGPLVWICDTARSLAGKDKDRR
ncbi:Protein of unknown function DUF1308 [Penicillium alfredii]|uniref:DUF1308 domain-containing protein n=1 Tax=Penicillium alfredii TaxID=1506179 RepID=A0A9W9KDJ2_9EURO|nr:Protein of unknown function DUF1308 [Penicillium alfredii]KAJ5101818.1 Protein of unknown function DUF1308 [Penicillium alfredii]